MECPDEMKRIDSLSQLSPLLLSQMKGGVVSNGAFSAASFAREIERGTLFAQTVPGGLLLFRRREDFWRMSFYLQREVNLREANIPAQTVMEIAPRPKDAALKETEQLWEKQGFRLLFSRRRMTLKRRREEFSPQSRCCVRLAEPKEQALIRQMMERNYDRRTACLPTEEELAFDIASQSLWLAIDEDSKAAGFFRLLTEKRVREVRQIAVEKEYRGQGIASALLDRLTLEEGQQGRVWVAQDNQAAIGLYESIGFEDDGRTSTVWLYE